MAAFARTDLDLLGLARRDNQAAVQLFVIRGGKALGRDVFLLDTPRGATDAEVVSGLPAPVLRPGHEHPAGDRHPAGAARCRGPRAVPRRPAGRRRTPTALDGDRRGLD